MKNLFLISATLFLLFSCNKKIETVEKSFYYWKSDDWDFTQKEDSLLQKNKIRKLYIKFFEVDNNVEMGNFPISKTNLHTSDYEYQKKYFTDSVNIIPVIYLKNEVFLHTSGKDIDSLASNVNFLINKYSKEKFEKKEIVEFQMDCDWTPKSKENYFEFLKKIKQISGKTISATLRLYPYKYPDKMGVPPVDKVTLMCYNLINPLQNQNKNSILDLQELKTYLKDAGKYPKHLDVALPIYSWMQVYQNDVFSGIIYGGKDLKKSLKELKPFWYQSEKDTVVNDLYIRKGDKIKFEEITSEDVFKAISLLKSNVNFDKKVTVSLFSLDESQINNYSDEEISRFYTDFTK